ncbi:50S ribosomal protein L25/general stress protein Ctc [Williamsia sterculiae]|uniref:Large ribosomal subunit protein bL25 n=1 Tax=Williamsia sterculiae TaxID=1344003 RepID=A0A1N7DNU5_9NOCA|nr:50S ribosomal protein L25/general stress protein Ctc [Williamsia sterculiae]SIR77487.1 LSU ribosomal protein L25P [Williamsia sterculiae]
MAATKNSANKLVVEERTGRGKGAARRLRRDGKVPAVVYGHGSDPRHLSLPALEFAAILRNSGLNAVIDLQIGGDTQLVLTKQVDVHPIRDYIEHADLLVIRRGEKVTVEVPVTLEGESAPGTLTTQDASTLEIEADALSIPEEFVVSVEGAEVGHTITAADVTLPEGVTLISDPETLVVSILEPQAVETEDEAEEDAEAVAEETKAADDDEAATEE